MPESKDTKAKIRKAALRLFAERGYNAVSMRDLAEAVGMRQGGLYNHFEGKQALLSDLMETHMVALLEARDTAMAGINGTRARLEAFVRHHVAHHLNYPDDVFLAYMEIRSLDTENRTRIVALRNRYEHMLRKILEDGCAEGLFSIGDAAVHARMLLAMMTGVTVWYRDNGRLARDEVVELYLGAALQSVGLAAEAS
ncbi:MAG: TetR/AcrR family transcriptional regulator [Boseongicola sp. SB0675_bin_26]|nr:TetR/AcrR family transcriptional regulator [Boseongicola sp. SB0675_bin_26]